MAKRKKQIEVELIETKKNTDDLTDLEVVVRKKVIGKLQQEKDGPVAVELKSGKKRTAQSIDEGMHMIIEEYNLHDE